MDTLPSTNSVWVVILVLVALSMIFTCCEQSTVATNDSKLKKLVDEGNKKARRLTNFLDGNSKTFVASMQFINCLLLISIGACSMLLYFADLTGYFINIGMIFVVASILAFLIIELLTTLVYLILGILVPKGIASKYAENMAVSFTSLSIFATYVCMPFIMIPSFISKTLLKILGVRASDFEEDVTEEEIRMMVDIGSESGVIDNDEKKMIHNIFELDDKPVEDIMTHRMDAVILWIDDDLNKWEKIINDTNHTRYPVCGNAIDDIVGVVNSRDFYKFLLKDRNGDIKTILREPYFVPETIKADEMFSQMQDKNAHFAIVLDEYGGFCGIVTQEDLIEEIVGELYSEYDEPEEEREIIKLSDSEKTWLIKGSAEIEDVAEELNISIPDDEYNTFAGLILDELGTVPADGETPELIYDRLKITVTKILDHRIDETIVTVLEIDENNAESETKDSVNEKNKNETEK